MSLQIPSLSLQIPIMRRAKVDPQMELKEKLHQLHKKPKSSVGQPFQIRTSFLRQTSSFDAENTEKKELTLS